MAVMTKQASSRAREWEVSVRLDPDLRAPRLCRVSAASAVRAYGLPFLADHAGLLASELVTNAVRHGRGPLGFRVAWYPERERLRITVWDEGRDRVPVNPGPPGPDREDGRGLPIVAAIATDWGQYGTPGEGKALWAELAPLPD